MKHTQTGRDINADLMALVNQQKRTIELQKQMIELLLRPYRKFTPSKLRELRIYTN